MDDETINFMIKDINIREDQLNEWESTFIADIEERVLSGRVLTEKQEAKLDDIYERVTENG